MPTYQAKQGDRLDSIYARFYKDMGLRNNYTNGYNAFVLANIHLMKDFSGVCKGGELIYLPNQDIEQDDKVVLGLWE